MFEDYWFWIFIAFLVTVNSFGFYRAKKLPPMQKELSILFYSFVTFGSYIVFLTFFSLFGNNVSSYVPEKINNIEEMQKILNEQSANIQSIKLTLYFFFLFFLISLLPAIYNFAKAVIPKDNEKVLNLNSEEKKPILGLNIE